MSPWSLYRKGAWALLAFAVLALATVGGGRVVQAQAQEVPTPPNVVISDITTTSAAVAVAATSGCDIENIILEYRQDPSDPYINIASGVCSDLVGNEYDLTGLAANTTYSVRVSATLADSIISTDVVTPFTTDPIAQAAVSSLDVSNITDTTARVVITTDNQAASSLQTTYRYRTKGVGVMDGCQPTWAEDMDR